ncbi:flagellar basal body-associated FliL family protein [Rhodocaloribacter sp.]
MAEELNEQPAAAPEGDAVKPKGGKSFLLMLLPVLFVALTGGGWIAFSYYPELMIVAEVFGRDIGSEESEEEAEPIEYGQFTELQGLIINPSDSEGTRYLMLNIGLEALDAGVLEEVDQMDMVIRDTILKQLSHRTVRELSDINLRDEIKLELKQAINDILKDGEITRLYFTQYVLQ